MKEVEQKIYVCEYCGRKMFGKGAMSLHERMCKKNPKNMHKCFQYCRWLYKTDNDPLTIGQDEIWGSSFYCGNEKCEFAHKKLHSYKLERTEQGRWRIDVEKLTRMPLECEHYEIANGHETFNKTES